MPDAVLASNDFLRKSVSPHGSAPSILCCPSPAMLVWSVARVYCVDGEKKNVFTSRKSSSCIHALIPTALLIIHAETAMRRYTFNSTITAFPVSAGMAGLSRSKLGRNTIPKEWGSGFKHQGRDTPTGERQMNAAQVITVQEEGETRREKMNRLGRQQKTTSRK